MALRDDAPASFGPAAPEPSLEPLGPGPWSLRFDGCELRLDSGELLRDGRSVRLEPQPARVLEFLARRAGEVVSREELQRHVWGEGTHVDYEQGLNYCVKQIRRALGERAGAPRYVETVPRRGYRFLPPVVLAESGAGARVATEGKRQERAAAVRWRRRVTLAASAALLLALAAGAWHLAARRAPSPAAVPAAAREAYVKALHHLERPGGEGVEPALAELAHAVAIAPRFADAHAALARAHLRRGGMPLDLAPVAAAAAHRALEADPSHAEALLTLALLDLYVSYDWPRAEERFRAALAASPGLADAHHHWAGYLAALGRHAEAQEAVAEARRLDPLSVLVHADAAWYLFFARRFEEAAAQARTALELAPHDPSAQQALIAALDAAGDEERALAEARAVAAALVPGGDTAGGRPALADLDAYWRWQLAVLAAQSQSRHVPPADFALARLALGEREEALALLTESCRQHCGLTMPFLGVDPRLDPLRSDPRFAELLDCIRLPANAPARHDAPAAPAA